MDLRFVEAFHWAATLKSVTRAAEKLHLTQSALSARLATLERELGVALLDRRDKQFRLTVAGTRFFAYAQRLLDLQREVRTELGQPGPRAVTLRVGSIESVLHSWLIDWIRQLRRDSPGIELALTVETSPVLAEQLRRGALDIAFAALPATGEGVVSRAMTPMPMAFVGHKLLHTRRRYALDDMARFDMLTFQRGSQPHVALLELFRKARLQDVRIHTLSSISAMVQLVENGFGVATLPLAAVQRLATRLPLKRLACDAPLLPLPIHASWREDPSTPLVGQVLEPAFEHGGLDPGRRSAVATRRQR